MKKALLKCKVSEGQFRTEKAVSLILADGKNVSFFIDNSFIEDIESDNYVKVGLFSKDPKEAMVQLPCETFETGTRWARVVNEDLKTINAI